jgi:hypothetical protein
VGEHNYLIPFNIAVTITNTLFFDLNHCMTLITN